MAIFDKYPELLLFDGTYKMNNLNMPLILQLCVDGNGKTEIASTFIGRSESCVSVGAMIDAFQSINPAWKKTNVILGDKDFADRDVYIEKFPDAVLQICLYLQMFSNGRDSVVNASRQEFSSQLMPHRMNDTQQSLNQAIRATATQPISTANSYQWIKLPPKSTPIGRTKGTVNTVVGKKRKNKTTAFVANSEEGQVFRKK